MKPPHLVKRSLTLQGHRTSVALEPAFWSVLDEAAAARNIATSVLIARLDAERSAPLASTLRLFCLAEALRR
ncbi:ribbon-helix-helix domain-containing protein [Thermaurantiacus sp.]